MNRMQRLPSQKAQSTALSSSAQCVQALRPGDHMSRARQ